MLNKKVEEAINAQINAELFSAYLYLSMAAYFDSINLAGFGNWMRVQTQEEMMHAMKFFDYVKDRGGRVELRPIDGPAIKWESPLNAFEEVFKHEVKVTALINNLVNVATEEKDHASEAMLQWFVTEQVEEEASADAVVQKLKLTGGDGAGLFMIDNELALRVFVPPAVEGA